MKFSATVVPTATGAYGPFKDDVGTEREGRTIAYLDFADADGGGPDRATAGEGVDLSTLELFKPVELRFELYTAAAVVGVGVNARKLRTFGPSSASVSQSPTAVPQKAAA